MNKVNFHTGRTFYQSTMRGTTSGWYFMSRNGRTMGPYLSPEALQMALQAFMKACISVGDSGGRRGQREAAA